MSYCKPKDIEEKIGDEALDFLSDYDSEGERQQENIISAIDESDGDIDAKLEERYTVPFTGTIPTVIKWISAWCAIEKMALSRGVEIEEGWRRIIDAKKDLLDQLANGDAIVPGQSSQRTEGPEKVYPDALPKLRGSRKDIDGNTVNTDVIPDGFSGNLDVW